MKKTQRSRNAVTNYDGIAKRLLDNMEDQMIIGFINSIFGREFRPDAEVTRLATETTDKETKQKRCDYFIKINDDLFLIEIQSYEDDEMALRIFEYGSRGALLHSKDKSGDTIEIQFPEPVVFYLRKEGKVHDRLSVRIRRSGSEEIFNYEAKVVYVEDYDIDGLIDNNMLPMIPFYPMRYEKKLDSRHTEQEEKEIYEDVLNCYKKLKEGLVRRKYSSSCFEYMRTAMSEVMNGMIKRMKKHNKILDERGAAEVMQKMVDDPIEMFDIFKALEDSRAEGKEEGKAEGIKEGKAEGHLDTARRMLSDKMPDDMIIKYSGITIEELERLKREE